MCNNVSGWWVATGRSGPFLEQSIETMDHGITERSTPGSLGYVSEIQKAALQLYRRNVPLLHTPTQLDQCPGMSQHVTSFIRPSSVSVLQATNVGVRRPGYETTNILVACRCTDYIDLN